MRILFLLVAVLLVSALAREGEGQTKLTHLTDTVTIIGSYHTIAYARPETDFGLHALIEEQRLGSIPVVFKHQYDSPLNPRKVFQSMKGRGSKGSEEEIVPEGAPNKGMMPEDNTLGTFHVIQANGKFVEATFPRPMHTQPESGRKHVRFEGFQDVRERFFLVESFSNLGEWDIQRSGDIMTIVTSEMPVGGEYTAKVGSVSTAVKISRGKASTFHLAIPKDTEEVVEVSVSAIGDDFAFDTNHINSLSFPLLDTRFVVGRNLLEMVRMMHDEL